MKIKTLLKLSVAEGIAGKIFSIGKQENMHPLTRCYTGCRWFSGAYKKTGWFGDHASRYSLRESMGFAWYGYFESSDEGSIS